eukprot:354602-Chlamydomonas_euryale.AAC.3
MQTDAWPMHLSFCRRSNRGEDSYHGALTGSKHARKQTHASVPSVAATPESHESISGRAGGAARALAKRQQLGSPVPGLQEGTASSGPRAALLKRGLLARCGSTLPARGTRSRPSRRPLGRSSRWCKPRTPFPLSGAGRSWPRGTEQGTREGIASRCRQQLRGSCNAETNRLPTLGPSGGLGIAAAAQVYDLVRHPSMSSDGRGGPASAEPAQPHAPNEVIVNVYDITADYNAWTYWCGVGVFHAGVEVYGVEYAYGGAGGVYGSRDGLPNMEVGEPHVHASAL